jgi:hypothetical protein
MREFFVTQLAKEVLGPRDGSRERMTASPLSEYLTGVLAPQMSQTRPDIESESEMLQGESQIYEDEFGDPSVQTPPLLSPALDPKSRPTSMGLSFLVQADRTPELNICLTWGKYEFVAANNWQRHPKSNIATLHLDGEHDVWIDAGGQRCERTNAEISLHVRSRHRGVGLHFVSLYFVNRIIFSPRDIEDLPNAEHHIFQPQIRVKCGNGTKIIPLYGTKSANEQDTELSFLYRNRTVLGRGHLCSVVWADIDPERAYNGVLQFPTSQREPPFHWSDGSCLPDQERARFTVPDIRTEFIAVYPIPAPELDWPANHGAGPELSAEVLANTWDPSELRRLLQPISDGYGQWIDEIQDEFGRLPSETQSVSDQIIEACRETLRRIALGIELLAADDDARLAFCLANQALDLQQRWTRHQGLLWRPFQLAFFLYTLESITNPNSPERDVCDLLWIPTGAGKTEAYFAISAYTLAYRRRRALRREEGDRTGAGVSIITRYTLRLLTIQQFRRALATVTACEYLRVDGPATRGWLPRGCSIQDECVWGTSPFELGLWVGIGVTPNRLSDTWGGNRPIAGALSILKGARGEGEPAQILNCPACNEILSISQRGLSPGINSIHLVIRLNSTPSSSDITQLQRGYGTITILSASIFPHTTPNYYNLALEIQANRRLTASDVDNLWAALKRAPVLASSQLVPVRASRPGYFIMSYLTARGTRREYDFSVICPNPACDLVRPWYGGAPAGLVQGRNPPSRTSAQLSDGNVFVDAPEPFRGNSPQISDRIPIPVLTTDEQVYRRVPTMLVATVDKFARLPFEARASGLFGNIDHHHCLAGYYRRDEPAWEEKRDGHPTPGEHKVVPKLDPPDLILQDELHLVEGPLGSLVGIYEAGMNFLIQENTRRPVKYIASTATIRRANEHVQ